MWHKKVMCNMSVNSRRQSNFEILRVFAMLGIIAFHIVDQAALMQLGDSPHFAQPGFAKRLMLFCAANTFGHIGNAVFILLAGYFLIDKPRINLERQVAKILTGLVFGVCFMVLLVFGIYLLQGRLHEAGINGKWPIYGSVGIFDINSFAWYFGYYFTIILIAQLFLNKRLAALSQGQYLACLACAGGLVTFAFPLGILRNLLSNSNDGLARVAMGVFLYMAGGFLKRRNPFKNVRAIAVLAIMAAAYGFLLISFYNATMSNVAKLEVGAIKAFAQSIQAPGNLSAFTVIVSVAVFELFSRLKTGCSKSVNHIASATMMVYILHNHEFMYSFYRMINWPETLRDSIARTVLMLAGITFAVFAYGFCVYSLQRGLAKIGRKLGRLAIKEGDVQSAENEAT
jgi:hypothetical protein